MWMSEIFKMSDPMSCETTHNGTSLLESGAGAMPCDAKVGQTIDPSSPSPVLANLTARQAKEQGLLTSDTYGRQPSTLSADFATRCHAFLASRLAKLSDSAGAILWKMTWKESVTPSGRKFFRLAASARGTRGRGCTSWLTTKVQNHKASGPSRTGDKVDLQTAAELSGWPTPNALPPNRGGLQSSPEKAMERRAQGHQLNLDDAATLASWCSPTAQDHSLGGQ